MSLKINVFGGVSISKDSEPLKALASKKTEALVLFICTSRQTYTREYLADMLWDRRTQERASGNLRVVLSSIRKHLGEYFDISRYEVSLAKDAKVLVDAVEFENRINCAEVASYHGDIMDQLQQLDHATHLYKGDFMQNYYLREASVFEDWVTRESARYRQLASSAYCDLLSLCPDLDDYNYALNVAHRFLDIDPYNEIAHRCVMRFQAVSDQRSAALRQYEVCRKMLADDLGVVPSVETEELREKILRGDVISIPRKTTLVTQVPARGGKTNLPTAVTSFIGREEPLNRIAALLRKAPVRMLTLTGPGGVGKTRLAIEAARNLLRDFPDGVFFVNLAPVSDPTMVTGRIARVLNVAESTRDSAQLELLQAYLKEKRILLLLDNFEQVIEAGRDISAILGGTDYLKILLTSRQPLRIYGEQTLPVTPLDIPQVAAGRSIEALSANDSVTLFVQRAEAANPAFELNAENILSVAEICMQLDGIPLALELAAARTTIYSPDYLSEVMKKTLDVLGEGPVDAPARHRRLRAALDWSYQLLSDEEKQLFTAMAVFEGGADLSSIDRVIPTDIENHQQNVLEALVRKSLLLRSDGFRGEPRFTMLKTIDQFASELLLQDGPDHELRTRHAEYFTELADEASSKLLGSDQGRWADRLRLEYDNILAALDWAFSDGEPAIGMRLFGAMWGYWYYDGQASDGLKWLDQLTPFIETVDEALLPAVFNTAGMLYFVIGDQVLGERWNRRAYDLAEKLGDRANRGWALFWLSAQLTSLPGQYEQAYAYCEESLVEFEFVDDRGGLAWAYNQLGEISRLLNDYDKAKSAYEKSILISRENRNARREAVALINLSTVAQYRGEFRDAFFHARDGLAALNRLGLVYHSAMTLALLAGPLISLNETEKAARLMGASAAIFRRIFADLQPADAREIAVYAEKAIDILGKDRFETLKNEGGGYTYEQAIRYALGEIRD